MSQVRFVIIAQARSGSTLLRLALHAHPDVVCHGEVLSAAWMNRLIPQGQKAVDQSPKDQILRLWDERENDPGQFLERWVYSGFSQSCIGFKIVYGDLLKGTRLGDQALAYFMSAMPRIIHLSRRDDLAAFVSRERMRLFGIAHSDKPIPDVPPMRVDIGELTDFVREQEMYRLRVDALFPDALRVAYEDLPAAFPTILDHLDLAPAPWTERLSKVGPADLAAAVVNFDEARAALGVTSRLERKVVEKQRQNPPA